MVREAQLNAFEALYNKTNAALEKKDYAKANDLLSEFKKIKYMHLSENNFLQLLSAQYASEIGDPALQLSHLNKVTLSSYSKNEKQQLSILEQKLILEIKLNQLKSAYGTYKRIEKMTIAARYIERYQTLIKRVDDFINSEKELLVNANIRDDDYWHHALVRNEFTLTNITGELTKMDIRCANKRHIYSIKSNNTWAIPDAWQQCHVFIFGEHNAKFNLVEHPFKA